MEIKKSILLVEDEALIAMSETLILEKQGFTVEHVCTAEEAVTSALSNDFDLILMDIDLGNDRMDGTEAAEQILLKIDLPIVFCTSHTEREMVDKVKDITRYGYVIKNSGEFVLIESIKMALELFETHCSLKKENSDRITAEKNYKMAAALYYQMMENSIDAVYLLNRIGEVQEINNVACSMLGYSKDELMAMTIDDIDINYPSAKFIEFWDEKPEGASILFESTHLHKSGRQIPVEVNGIFFKHEGEKYLFGVARDISDRQKIENQLRDNEALIQKNAARYIKAQTLGNVGNWEYNIQTDEFWGSDQAKRIYGFNPESDNFSSEKVESCIPERTRVHQALLDLINKNKKYNLEFDIITNDTHEKKTIDSIAELERDSEGNPLKVTGVIHDITEMKRALYQKEILMKELSHRVKNNLMMISSLISLTDSDIKNISDLSGLKNQIDAIMNTYNSLYQTDDFAEINIKEYINNLLENVFAQVAMKVKIEIKTDLDIIPSGAAVSIGLIINETAINALKHGFKETDKPEFHVELKEDSVNSKIVLNISNNGVPIPESVQLENPGTLGLRLITELVSQMRGSIEMHKAPHPGFTISLPASISGKY